MGVHKITGEIYIGYREANKTPSHLDLFRYKTSSKVVNPNFNSYGWHIVAEFMTGDDAYDYEQQLIYENWNNPLLINAACFHGKQRFKCVAISEKHKQSISKAQSGKSLSDSTKEKIRNARAQQICTDVTKEKISRSLIGNSRSKKLRTPETKEHIKQSLALTYLKTPKVLGMLGKHHSAETREKMKLAQQARRSKNKS